MSTINDKTYGEITVRRHALSRQIKLSVSPAGELIITAPLYTPLALVKLFIKSLHKDIGKLISVQTTQYTQSMAVGKSHRLIVEQVEYPTTIVYKKPLIRVYLNHQDAIASPSIQKNIREYIVKALKVEAKAYLPRRVAYLAKLGNFRYEKVRFSHAKSRWGSCSSEGVISLNIALMKLENTLIDYVIIHELAHTRHMNHSSTFWSEVAKYDPLYKQHKKILKTMSPHI